MPRSYFDLRNLQGASLLARVIKVEAYVMKNVDILQTWKVEGYGHKNLQLVAVTFSGVLAHENFEDSTSVRTTLSTTVLSSPHLLCPAKVRLQVCLPAIAVHNAWLTDSAYFAQPMSDNSTFNSLSLVHLCIDTPADSTCIAPYRQYARTVLHAHIPGSSQCSSKKFRTNYTG